MSYIVSVSRGPGNPIRYDEVNTAVAQDLQFKTYPLAESVGTELLFGLAAEGSRVQADFHFSDGVIRSTRTPSNAALQKLQQLAKALDARLLGEEGEDLSAATFSDPEPSAASAWGCYLLVAALVAAVVWWLVHD